MLEKKMGGDNVTEKALTLVFVLAEKKEKRKG